MSQSSWRQNRCPGEGGKRLLGASGGTQLLEQPQIGFLGGKGLPLGCVGVQVTPNPAAPSSGYLQLPLEDVNLSAAVLCELYVPNVLGVCWCCLTSLLLDFPLPLISVSIRLVAALSRDASMGSRRNQAFNFRNCQKSSTRGKHNYFRSHAGF